MENIHIAAHLHDSGIDAVRIRSAAIIGLPPVAGKHGKMLPAVVCLCQRRDVLSAHFRLLFLDDLVLSGIVPMASKQHATR